MIDLILSQIQVNKISTVEVSDALNKTGILPKIRPLNRGLYSVGKVHYVSTWSKSNWPLHKQIQSVPPDSIVFVDAIDCDDIAVLGDIVAKQLFTYQRISGLVVNGYVRDAHRLIKENYPIWTIGTTPLGCHNTDVAESPSIRKSVEARKQQFHDSIIVADDSGCTLIESKHLTEDFLNSLQRIELQEDIWYYCLDTLKMNTYEIICLKRYLNDPSMLPSVLVDKISSKLP